MVAEPLLYGFLPFDPVIEVIFFMLMFVMLVPIVALFMIQVIRSRRFGFIFPPEVIGIKLNPSQTAGTVSLRPTKDTVETRDQSEIYHAHQRSIYTHTKSGVRFALIEPISDFSQNIRLVHYIMKLREGVQDMIPKCNSLFEARLYYYENVYLKGPEATKLGAVYIQKELKKIEQAKGLLDVMTDIRVKEDGISSNPDGTTTQLRTQTESEQSEGPMSPAAFDDLMLSIQERAISAGQDIFPISIDGETVTFNGLERWMASPSPENTLDEQFARGYRKGQRDFSKSSTDFLKIAFAFLIIALAAAFLFTKV